MEIKRTESWKVIHKDSSGSILRFESDSDSPGVVIVSCNSGHINYGSMLKSTLVAFLKELIELPEMKS